MRLAAFVGGNFFIISSNLISHAPKVLSNLCCSIKISSGTFGEYFNSLTVTMNFMHLSITLTNESLASAIVACGFMIGSTRLESADRADVPNDGRPKSEATILSLQSQQSNVSGRYAYLPSEHRQL